MDKDYFTNTGISPWSELNRASDQPFFDRNNSDQFPHFDSSEMSTDVFALRELIGKLGSCSTAFADESPNNLTFPVLDHRMSIVNSGNSAALAPTLAADPGFAERAAKFSCFGRRSFNGGTSRLGMDGNGESRVRSNSPLMGNGKLPRVSSSPALKKEEIPRTGNDNNWVLLGPEKKFSKFPGSNANSPNEDSTISEQIPSGETGSKLSNETNSRKRKVVSRGKNKEDGSNSAKGVGEGETEIEIAKRSKSTKTAKIKDEAKGGSNDENENQKLPEPPKDYIHVRARRGQATDSHSLAERVRREKISERMKLLQDLVPGCNKVTGKALMLDEIINYVQSLQRQVEFLSMKLSSVTPGLDFNVGSLLSKDMFQQNANLPQQIYPLDPSSSPFYHQQQQNIQQPKHNSTNFDGFNETLSQFSSFSEDDLHSVVRMVGFPVPDQMKIEAMDDGTR